MVKRARLLTGGSYKGKRYEPVKVLRIGGENILFRRIKNRKGRSNIQVLGLLEDNSKIGEFELEYVESEKQWVSPQNGPVKEGEPQIWGFNGENDYKYRPEDFQGHRDEIKKLLQKFTDGPLTFFHE